MSDVRIRRITVGSMAENCYIVYREGMEGCLLVDPGDEGERICQILQAMDLIPEVILLTHGHFDHIGAISQNRKSIPKVQIYAGELEKEVLESPAVNLSSMFGQPVSEKGDRWLEDGEEICPAGIPVKVLLTPGHTKGSVCYWLEGEGCLFSGDTLFADSLGRTDFPTGDTNGIICSIKEKLFVLPDRTQVYPGHGAYTDIGYEKKNNPVATYRR